MATSFAGLRGVLSALLFLALAVCALPALAQQQPSSVNPTADSVKEEQLLEKFKAIRGLGRIPDTRSYTIEQPAGRDWRHYHQVTLRWIGALLILGILALLTFFYLARGRMRLEHGRSGETIVRFSTFERFLHWMTTVCFIVLAISGLNITFGRAVLLPLMSPEAFTLWSELAKYAHNYLSFPFTLGVIIIFFIWIAENLPTRVDVEWFRRGGGFVGGDHPPARRFNGGQKLYYWGVVVGGAALATSGYVLIFPFYGTSVATMQWAEIVHSFVAMVFIAATLAHIYIGSVGMEGAFEGMSEGTVDLNWAKEHHSLWVEEELAREDADFAEPRAKATPGE